MADIEMRKLTFSLVIKTPPQSAHIN